LTTDPVPPPVLAVIDAVKPRHLTVPSVDELLAKQYAPFVLDKTFQEARWEPLLIMCVELQRRPLPVHPPATRD
jgi:hypothetical protein